MAKTLGDLEQIEQELAELRNKLEQSLGVLDGLIKVQAQFEDLAQTYQKLKEHLNQVKASGGNIARVQATFNHQFAELQKVVESRWGEVKSELSTVDQNLSDRLAQQIAILKGEVEERLTVFRQEWTSSKKAIQTSLDELEVKLKTEQEVFLSKFSDAEFNPEYFQKQTKLEVEQNLLRSQMSSFQSSMREAQRELRVMRNRLIIASLLAGIVLPSLTVWLFATFKG